MMMQKLTCLKMIKDIKAYNSVAEVGSTCYYFLVYMYKAYCIGYNSIRETMLPLSLFQFKIFIWIFDREIMWYLPETEK